MLNILLTLALSCALVAGLSLIGILSALTFVTTARVGRASVFGFIGGMSLAVVFLALYIIALVWS